MEIEQIKTQVVPILRRHRIAKAGLFGSVVRGYADAQSDIDILVQLGSKMGLFGICGYKARVGGCFT